MELVRCPGMVWNLVGVTIVGTAGAAWFSAFLEIHLADVVRNDDILNRICFPGISFDLKLRKRYKESV